LSPITSKAVYLCCAKIVSDLCFTVRVTYFTGCDQYTALYDCMLGNVARYATTLILATDILIYSATDIVLIELDAIVKEYQSYSNLIFYLYPSSCSVYKKFQHFLNI